MRLPCLCLLALAALALGACATKPVDYEHVRILPPLQMPDGLQPPRTNDTMAIPGLPLEDVAAVQRRLTEGGEAKDIELPPAMQPASAK